MGGAIAEIAALRGEGLGLMGLTCDAASLALTASYTSSESVSSSDITFLREHSAWYVPNPPTQMNGRSGMEC